MGSQALDVLRQGVWASATGGWFHDPHQTFFCNTAHLYIWLFLLCLPFTVYLYFPPSISGWCVYCGLVAVFFCVIKLLNFALHHMYDTSECIIIPADSSTANKRKMQKRRDMEAIEMQTIGNCRMSTTRAQSDNESVTSLEFHKPVNSTIDLKVDVHRKNSSESSIDEVISLRAVVGAVSVQHAERAQQTEGSVVLPSSSNSANAQRSRYLQKYLEKCRNHDIPSSDSKNEDVGLEEAFRLEICSKTEDSVAVNIDDDGSDGFGKSGLYPMRKLSYNQDISNGDLYMMNFPGQLSSDSRDNSEISINGFQTSPIKKKISSQPYYPPFPIDSCTKSTTALGQSSHISQSSSMRRNSNSTMSTIQLPLVSSTAQLVTLARRHSNATNGSLGFLPTGSVELGAYMLIKANDEASCNKSKSSTETRMPGVRRIKSTALEVGCLPPSVSNLSPHPNSVETIGGQVLKNPKSAIIPPPSKCLIRNPHLNLWPKNSNNSTEGAGLPYLNYGSEIVYPIAEISDEMQTSQCQESDIESLSSHCDYDEDNGITMRHQLRGFDPEYNRPLEINSSDTDYENNGSRSPLLDRIDCLNDVKIVKTKPDRSNLDKNNPKGLHKNHSFSVDSKSSDKIRHERNKKLLKNNSFNATSTVEAEEDTTRIQDVDPEMDHENQCDRLIESSESRVKIPKQKRSKPKNLETGDYFDKTSASSKDFLLEKSSVDSNECLIENIERHIEKLNLDKECKKLTDVEISNSSGSLEMQDARQDVATETSDISDHKTSDSQSKDVSPTAPKDETDPNAQSEDNSLYGIVWLFDEGNHDEDLLNVDHADASLSMEKSESVESNRKNLGAIPKQIKNVTKTHNTHSKEHKRRDKSRRKQKSESHEIDENNAYAMSPSNREHKRHSSDHRKDGGKRKPTEESSQISNAILPTSTPLLSTFLNPQSDYLQIPMYLPGETDQGIVADENQPYSELCRKQQNPNDRVPQCRLRRGRKLNRHRYNGHGKKSKDAKKNPNNGSANNNVHFATSFDDTTDGAIHCFMDECGNLMSYTFDKTSSGHATKEASKSNLTKSESECNADSSVLTASCVSISSSITEDIETAKSKEIKDQAAAGDSICNSPSNETNNNPLLIINNNYAVMCPIVTNNGNSKRRAMYLKEPTYSNLPHRSPASIETILERNDVPQITSQNMQLNLLLNSYASNSTRNESNPSNMLHLSCTLPVSCSIGDNSVDLSINQPITYYKFKLSKCWQIKVTMDRLRLLALFDRNLTLKEAFLSIMLGILVSVLGALVLHMGFYKDICAFWFCFVIAGSQYSLLKSVQPDSASPVHGFNRMVAFSRPVYFCLFSLILCIVHYNLESYRGDSRGTESFSFFGILIWTKEILIAVESIVSIFLLFLPLAFSFGLFPQVNTFAMYLFEQIDMHLFGGNATASLVASMYCVFRSLLAVAVLYGFAYGGLTESKGSSQHILFSIFCGLVVPISYHLSRCASDYKMVWNIIKNHLIPSDIYAIHSSGSSTIDVEKQSIDAPNDKPTKSKENSESNISKPPSIGSSTSKINLSTDTNISKSQKRSQTSVNSSVNSLKIDSRAGANLHSSGSIKMDLPTDDNKNEIKKPIGEDSNEEEMEDPLPKKLQETVNSRFKNDIIVCCFMALFIFGIHCTTVFSTLQPELNPVLWSIAGALGWILHYLIPQLRKQLPWLWLSSPVLKAREHAEYEVREPAKVMWFEKVYVYLCFFERNVLYPIIIISALTQDSPQIMIKFGPGLGALIICICALKSLRNAYSDLDNQYLILVFAILLFRVDYGWASETFLIDYFIMGIIFNKVYEFLLKIQFVVTYIAPWQITWGSPFHAIAQPFSVPHSAILFLQAAISAILSTPLNPILGSAIFISSYVRPVKFWERDYNTKRVDQTNTRLSSQLERNLGSDDNNLNSIFYEHLTRSLQHYLCGDLQLGRWGQVQQGDCFVMASDYLNCLVHIVEMGNGLVSFQLRGLEFRGTYCQQREVEAITEGPEHNKGCCCCNVGHLPRMLSVNAMFSLRWLAWQLTTAQYVLEGYSISDNNAVSMLQVFDFRKVLITYYVKSIIFYAIHNPKLEEWLTHPSILEALKPTLDRNFVDLDPTFNLSLDEDFDPRASGVTRASFYTTYHAWISHCGMKRDDLYKQKGDKLIARDSPLVSLCFGLSLVGRRTLGTASHNGASSVEIFLHTLHALFKGDFRIMCVRDEWVFTDMSLLHSVLAPAIRMALKLHQDHFMSPEEYCSCPALYAAISNHTAHLVICHEASPTWRNNVLRGAPHLLSFRHAVDDGNDEYKIIMLNKRYLSFRVIKLNRECVRGLWAGQQQELIYLRNRNPERGSIQNARQALRNIINSSCDQPIGYPIYVSPLTTSYAETNQQLTSLIGGSLTLGIIKKHVIGLWRKMRRRCGEGCSSGSGSNTIECGNNSNTLHLNQTPHHTLDLSRTSLAGNRGSLASVGKPGSSTLASSLAGLLGSRDQPSAPPSLQIPELSLRVLDSDSTYSTIGDLGEKNTYGDQDFSHVQVRNNIAPLGALWRNTPSSSYCARDSRGSSSIRDRTKESARRPKRERERERIRPSSFRLLSAQEREGGGSSSKSCNEGYEMSSIRSDKKERLHGSEREKSSSSKENKRERTPSSKLDGLNSASFVPTPDSSLEDLSCNPRGDNYQIIINRNANSKHSSSFDQSKESHKRRSSDISCSSGRDYSTKHHNSDKSIDVASRDPSVKNLESTSEHSVFKRSCGDTPRELTKTSKDIRLERESYRDLTGKYSELSIKESGLRIAGDPKDTSKKNNVKRSESLKSELKTHVSIGCKVVIVDPSGVYDCINLGRRIDVKWPSTYQSQRGGRNYWGAWVPQQGMDGQVVHRWTPNHRDPNLRSHVDKTILLVQIGDRFVPIAENCVQDLGDEV